MRRVASVVALVMAACLVPALAFAQSAPASTGGAFIVPGYGARAWGMAGAVSAVVDDESAADWNPSRIGLSPRSVSLSYVNLVPGVTAPLSQAAFVTPLGPLKDGAVHHSLGVIVTDFSPSIESADYSENTLRVAYAITPEPFISFGIAGQLLHSSSDLPGFGAWGSSFDFGGRLSLSENWEVAAVAKDLFSRYNFDDGYDARRESRVVVGVASRSLPMMVLSADAVRQYATWSNILFGAESDYLFDHVALRAGIALRRAGESRTSYAFGASARVSRLVLHYAANIDDETALGTTHQVTVAFGI
jgi:hypothetical protein